MSAQASEEPHSNQVDGAIVSLASPLASRASLWRARKLFDLAVTASGAAPASVARAIGIDIRTIEHMRDTPTVGAIARIASALGLDLAAAVEVVGADAATHGPHIAFDDAVLRGQLLEADLDDDALQLERLANRIADDPDRPHDFGVAVLLGARAAAARCEVEEARQRLQFSQHFPADSLPPALFDMLAGCMAVEALLGSPWEPLHPDWSRRAEELARVALDGTLEALEDNAEAQIHGRALAARSTSCAQVRALFLAIARENGRTVEALDALRASVEQSDRSMATDACAHAVAWTASLAGVAALRAVETTRLNERGKRIAIELLVQSQFALDEAIAVRDASRVMPLLRRRARLALHEWCDRARRGELPDALLDELDVQEVRTIFVRFPGARRGALASMDLQELRAKAV